MNAGPLASALDMLDYALIIVDERGWLEYRNRSAALLLRRPDGPLLLTAGVVRGRTEALRAQLVDAIERADATQRAQALFAANAGSAPLRMVLAPIGLAPDRKGVVMWIARQDRPALPEPATLRSLFGLSAAEARLALGLLAGRTAGECARRTGIGIATVRSQLHVMFAKTGTRRQAELVALLSRIPALDFSHFALGDTRP